MDFSSSHAHVVFGDSDVFLERVTTWIASEYGEQEDGVTFFSYKARVLKIADVRNIQHPVTLRSAQNVTKHVVIRADLIPMQAQNALLKTLEDPQSDTRFYINLPVGSHVIPTILSRTAQHTLDHVDSADSFAKNFLSSHYVDRLEIYEQLKHENDKGKMVFDKNKSSVFISELLSAMTEQAKAANNISADDISSILQLQKYILDPSASTKQIMESIATLTPVIK